MRAPLALALALIGTAVACSAPAPQTAQSQTSNSAQGSPAPAAIPSPGSVRWTATGALFGGPPEHLGDHYCTAAVVDSPAGDIVITAAHCVAGGDGTPARTGMSFAPGYHDHTAPFGIWTVATSAVDDAWRDHADPDYDFAFLTVKTEDGRPVQHVVGGYRLVLDPGSGTSVDAVGYPDFAEAPNERLGITSRFSPSQLELDAYGLYDGTSGGPWLRTSPDTEGDTEVVAVTGGHEQGGSSPDVSYAAYLGTAAAALYHRIAYVP